MLSLFKNLLQELAFAGVGIYAGYWCYLFASAAACDEKCPAIRHKMLLLSATAALIAVACAIHFGEFIIQFFSR